MRLLTGLRRDRPAGAINSDHDDRESDRRPVSAVLMFSRPSPDDDRDPDDTKDRISGEELMHRLDHLERQMKDLREHVQRLEE